jgi:hypothetical protein
MIRPLRRLERALPSRRGGLTAYCDLLLAELVADTAMDDDIAMLVMRLTSSGPARQ